MARRTGIGWMIAAVIALAALVGCGDGGGYGKSSATMSATTSASASASADYVSGTPPGVTVPADAAGGVGWSTDHKGEMWVLTYGSSSNPLVATKATADGQTVTIALGDAKPGEPATNDLVPTTSYITAPEGIDSSSPVTVVLGDLGTAEVMDASNPGWLLLNS